MFKVFNINLKNAVNYSNKLSFNFYDDLHIYLPCYVCVVHFNLALHEMRRCSRANSYLSSFGPLAAGFALFIVIWQRISLTN